MDDERPTCTDGTCTDGSCRTRAPALMITAIGIGIIAGLALESVLGLATPVALGLLLASACCARKRILAGRALPFGKAVLIVAGLLFGAGGLMVTAVVDVVAPHMTIDSLVIGGLWLTGGTACAAVFLAICSAVSWLRRSARPRPLAAATLPAAGMPAE